MRNSRIWRVGLAICCCVLLLALVVQAADDRKAPNWKLKCADGKTVEFYKELDKGPVLVSFWALWCKPCLKEMPHIDELAKEYPDQLSVLAVNIDSPQSVARVRPYVSSKGYKVKVPLDTSGDLQRLMQIGSVVPFLVLYDTDGSEVYRHIGYKQGDEVELQKKVAELLHAGESGSESENGGNAEPESTQGQRENAEDAG